MEELIRRNAAIKTVCEACGNMEKNNDLFCNCAEKAALKALPSIHRPLGKWINDDKENNKYYRCSQCGVGYFNYGTYNYCPNCGCMIKK